MLVRMGQLDLGENKPPIRTLEAIDRPNEAIMMMDVVPHLENDARWRQRDQGTSRQIERQRILVFQPTWPAPRPFEGQQRRAIAALIGADANANPQPVDATEVTLGDAVPARHPRRCKCCAWITHEETSLNLDGHGAPDGWTRVIADGSERFDLHQQWLISPSGITLRR